MLAALLRGSLVATDALGLCRPRRLILNSYQDLESVADRVSEATEGGSEGLVQLVAARLIVAVENLIHHDDHSFPLHVRTGHSATG